MRDDRLKESEGSVPFLRPPIAFRREGPFYALVICHLCQLHGFNEAASRGIQAKSQAVGKEIVSRGLAALADEEDRRIIQQILDGGTTPLLARSQIASQVRGIIDIDVAELGIAISADRLALSALNAMSTGALLLLAWERVKRTIGRNRESRWEFLYHCRNAAAHSGRFTFKNGEPKHPAEWEGLVITAGLEGKLLVNDGSEHGFLGVGDAVCLLADLDAIL